jgi:hypothetical protein
MRRNFFFLFVAILASMVYLSCDDTALVGSNLLDDETLDYQFNDTTTIHSRTILGRPVNSGRLSSNTYMVGTLEDPVFGKVTSDVYLGLQVLDQGPDFSNKTIDSMVLAIAYDTSGFYGEQNAFFDFEIYRTLEPIQEDTTFSNETLPIEATPLTDVDNKFISPDDTLVINDPALDSIVNLLPHFRLPILPSFGVDFFTQIKFVQDEESLNNVVPALYLQGTPDRSSLMGLSIGNTNRLGDFNKLLVYMKDSIDAPELYEFRFKIDRFSHFEHDYSGSEVEPFLNDVESGDSLFFVQGIGGVNGVLDISSVLQYDGFLINKAEIELTINEDPRYNPELYPSLENYGASYVNEDDILVSVQDLNLVSDFGLGVFGGQVFEEVENGVTLKKVKMNITNHVKNYIEVPSVGGEIIITSLFDSETPGRTVFYGAGHSKYPAKLNIAFTKP